MINMGSLGEVGVCIFLLITGYFSFKSTITISSLAKTAFQIWFYSILCLVIAYLLKIEINPGAFSLFPIISGTYWFASTYVGLYLSIPLINIIIRNVTQRAHLRLTRIGYLLLCVIPFIFQKPFVYSNYLFFCYVYLLGAYIGKYSIEAQIGKLIA